MSSFVAALQSAGDKRKKPAKLRTWRSWKEVWDSRKRRTYWYNKDDTSQVQWTPPEGFTDHDVPAPKATKRRKTASRKPKSIASKPAAASATAIAPAVVVPAGEDVFAKLNTFAVSVAADSESAAPAGPHHASEAETQTQEEPDDGPADEDVVQFGAVHTRIVGIQHYSGAIGHGESAVVRRDPTNRFDRNAVAAYNQNGQALGHLPAKNGLAGLLSPFMRDNPEIQLEVLCISTQNKYYNKVNLSLMGFEHDRAKAEGFIQRISYLSEVHAVPATKTAAGAGKKKAEATVLYMDTKQHLRDKLEEMYDHVQSYDDMPGAVAGPRVTTRLHEHQRKALWWLRQQERPRSAATVLAEGSAAMRARGDAGIFKLVTQNATQYWQNCFSKTLVRKSQPPQLHRGGIFADDMGLGKTLTMLALIAGEGGSGGGSGVPPQPASLVCCPLSVLYEWETQAATHCPDLKISIFHGSNRSSKGWDKVDVVLTTYEVLGADFKRQGTASSIHKHQFARCVFDEAHNLRNRNARKTKAVLALQQRGPIWMVTGTPIQNKVVDLFPLVSAIGIAPFTAYAFFQNRIMQPLKANSEVGHTNLRTLVGATVLRRHKGLMVKDNATGRMRPLVALPGKTVRIAKISLSAEDQRLYDQLFAQSKTRAETLFGERGNGGNAFMGILTLLGRLRQLCCDPRLLPEDLASKVLNGEDVCSPEGRFDRAAQDIGVERATAMLSKLVELAEDECAICLEPGSTAITRCGHMFHKLCIDRYMASGVGGKSTPCPLCRNPVRATELLEALPPAAGPDGEPEAAATGQHLVVGAKIKALKEYINALGPTDKLVVFSSFTKFLKLAMAAVRGSEEAHGRFVCMLDGSMSRAQRQTSQRAIQEDPSCRILFASLKAGGVGVNLTSANHLILLDPWWNPAAEEQAVDRIYRIGQSRPVCVTRFVIANSIEDRMLDLAAQKRAIYDGAFAKKSAEELKKIRWEAMASLFE